MTKQLSAIRILAAVIAVSGLCWLVANVNTHGDELQRGLASTLGHSTPAPVEPTKSAFEPEFGASSGLELVDMYQCMCGPSTDDIRGWVGLWLVAAMIGGLPTAVLVHAPVTARRRA